MKIKDNVKKLTAPVPKESRSVYTPKDVAACFGITTGSVWNWMEQGKLKAFKTPGGRRRIRKEEFDRFIRKYIKERKKGNGFKKSDFLRLGEVARHFGVSKAAVRIWIKQGKLKAILTPGGHRRIRKEDFKKFMKKYPGKPDPT